MIFCIVLLSLTGLCLACVNSSRAFQSAVITEDRFEQLLQRAEAYRKINLDSSLIFINRAINLGQLLEYKQVKLLPAIQLKSILLAKLGQHQLSQKLMDSSLKILDNAIVSNELLHRSDFALGSLELSKGHYEEAAVMFDNAETLALRIDNPCLLGSVYLKKGRLEKLKGNIEKSLLYLKKVDSIALFHSDLSDCQLQYANSLNNQGEILLELDRAQKAGAYFKRSIEIKKELEAADYEFIATHNNLGQCYELLEEFDKAKFHFEEALCIAKALNSPQRIGRAYYKLAHLFYLQRKFDWTGLLLERSNIYFEKSNNTFELAINKILEGKVNYENSNFSIAKEKYSSALELSSYPQIQTLANIELGKTYKASGQYKEAINCLEKATISSEDLPHLNRLGEINELLSDIYAMKGDYKKALEYHDKTLESTAGVNQINGKAFIVGLLEADLLLDEQKLETSPDKYLRLRELQLKDQEILQNNAVFALLIILLVVVIAIRNRNAKNRANKSLVKKNKIVGRQNEAISHQKEMMVNQNIALHQLNSVKDQLFAVLSHDLRSPIGKLESSLNLLLSRDLTKEEFISMATALRSNTLQIYQTLENLLEWVGQQMDGDSDIKIQEINIQRAIDNIIAFYSEMSAEKNIKILNKVSPMARLFMEAEHFQIIFRNLIGNAVKFTPLNGSISIDSRIEKDIVCVSVRDNGIGIPDEQIDKLFHFSQKNRRRGTSGEKGIGLGLYLCLKIVETYNGKISIKSQPNMGSTFTIRIPLKQQKYTIKTNAELFMEG